MGVTFRPKVRAVVMGSRGSGCRRGRGVAGRGRSHRLESVLGSDVAAQRVSVRSLLDTVQAAPDPLLSSLVIGEEVDIDIAPHAAVDLGGVDDGLNLAIDDLGLVAALAGWGGRTPFHLVETPASMAWATAWSMAALAAVLLLGTRIVQPYLGSPAGLLKGGLGWNKLQ